MKEIKQFPTVALADGGGTAYDTEFSGRVVDSIGFRFDLTVTATGGGTVAGLVQDAPFTNAGTPEVVQAEEPLVRMSGPDWRHLSALSSGGYDQIVQALPTVSASLGALGMASIDLSKFVPGALVDANVDKVFMRGTFGANARYAATFLSTLTGTLRPWVRAIGGAQPPVYWRPRWSQKAVDASSSSSLLQTVYRFERALLVRGLFLRQRDASAEPTGGRVDGLVKRVRAEITRGGGGTMEIANATWGIIRQITAFMAGFTPADYALATGTGLLPVEDPARPFEGGGVYFLPGDSLTVTYDTAATAEADITSVTPATGDQLVITLLAFERIGGDVSIENSGRVRGAMRRPNGGLGGFGARRRKAR